MDLGGNRVGRLGSTALAVLAGGLLLWLSVRQRRRRDALWIIQACRAAPRKTPRAYCVRVWGAGKLLLLAARGSAPRARARVCVVSPAPELVGNERARLACAHVQAKCRHC